jgi:predicted N-formylglutamate amidohydrolase
MDSLLAQGIDARVNDPYGGEQGPGGAVGAYGGDRPTLMIEARQDLMCERSSHAALWRRQLMASLLHCIGDPAFKTIPQEESRLPLDWLGSTGARSRL